VAHQVPLDTESGLDCMPTLAANEHMVLRIVDHMGAEVNANVAANVLRSHLRLRQGGRCQLAAMAE